LNDCLQIDQLLFEAKENCVNCKQWQNHLPAKVFEVDLEVVSKDICEDETLHEVDEWFE